MKTIRRIVAASLFTGLLAPLAQAGMTTAEAATACKTEAQARFAQGEELARVKFKGIYGGNAVRKVRLQVLPAEGKPFFAICEVNRRSGDLVSLQAKSRPDAQVATTNR